MTEKAAEELQLAARIIDSIVPLLDEPSRARVRWLIERHGIVSVACFLAACVL